MDHVEILKLINRIERDHPVLDWRSGDTHIWPLIRIKLAFLLYNKNLLITETSNISSDPPKGFSQTIINKINWKNRSLKHRIDNFIIKNKLGRNNTAAFFTLVANRTLLDNVWHNRSVDPIADILREMKVNVRIFEFKGGMDYKYPRYNDQLCTNFEEIFNVNATAKRSGVKSELSLVGYDNLLVSLKKEMPELNIASISEDALSKLMISFHSYSDYMLDVLKTSKVKICFTTCYYDTKMMAIIHACKKLNILTVELPHGTHGDTHAAFGKWERVPKEGYSVLPDIFWCWSENEKQALDAWIKPQDCKHEALLGGNAWISFWDKSNPFSDRINQKIKRLNNNAAVNVLYSAQPFNALEEVMPSHLLEAIRTSPADWKWWIRLHPRQPQSVGYFEEIFEQMACASKVNVEEATKLPLPPLLKKMDVHITIFSSVVLEAAEMGVPSIVLSRNGQTIYESLIHAEMLYLAQANAADVLEGVKRQASSKRSNEQKAKFDSAKLTALMKRTGII